MARDPHTLSIPVPNYLESETEYDDINSLKPNLPPFSFSE